MATSPLSTTVLPRTDSLALDDLNLVDLGLGPVERLEYGQNAADIAADNMAWITAEAIALRDNDDFDALLKDTVQQELDDGLLEPVLRDADATVVSRKQQELDELRTAVQGLVAQSGQGTLLRASPMASAASPTCCTLPSV